MATGQIDQSATERRAVDESAAAEVFFDGACPVCRAEIAVYRDMADDQVAWRDVADPSAASLPTGYDRDRLLARFHVRRRDGRIVSGTAAFLSIWRATRWARVARVLDRQPFLWIGDRIYAAFLVIRPLWRKKSAHRNQS